MTSRRWSCAEREKREGQVQVVSHTSRVVHYDCHELERISKIRCFLLSSPDWFDGRSQRWARFCLGPVLSRPTTGSSLIERQMVPGNVLFKWVFNARYTSQAGIGIRLGCLLARRERERARRAVVSVATVNGMDGFAPAVRVRRTVLSQNFLGGTRRENNPYS